MIITSGILGQVAAAIKRSLSGVFETDITIPPVIQPITELRDNLRVQFTAFQAGLQSSSFHLDFSAIVTNAAQNSTLICTLDVGAWELDITAVYESNYISNAGFQLIGLLDPSGANIQSNYINMGALLATGGPYSVTRKLKLNLDKPMGFQFVLNTNGAAQSHMALLQLLASKLL